MIKISKAKIHDVPGILNIVNNYAAQGLMLKRSTDEVLQNLRDFFVAHNGPEVIGVAALHIYTDRLSEIKALAVSSHFQKQGLATRLINKCLKEAGDLGIKRVFALTYAPHVFQKLNFLPAQKEELPEKIWKECSQCSKFEHCDEICLAKNI